MRGGRHLLKNIGDEPKKDPGTTAEGKKGWKKKTLKILSIAGGVLVVLTAAAYAYVRLAVAPPPVHLERRPGTPRQAAGPAYAAPIQTQDEDPTGAEEDPEPYDRDEYKFTFIMFCNDDVGGNTDVIMVATFDATNYTLNVVSIPRDTMSNVSWSSKKANAIRANRRIQFRGQDDAEEKAMQATIESFADILGFEVDYWFNVDMKAFVTLVDAVGGVDYYIPSNMEYHDNEQNLHISYKQGMKHGITGKQALEILRFRRYASGDIARISNQQGFLKAAAEQIIAKRNSINVVDLANIFINNVKTNLSLNHLIWIGKELLKMDSGDIEFKTMPGNYVDSVDGVSYVSIFVEQWLEMVNTLLNPFSEAITDKDVSILTRGPDRKLFVTDGNRQGNPSWGSGSRGASESSANNGGSFTPPGGSQSNTPKNPSGSQNASQGNQATGPNESPDAATPDSAGDEQDNDTDIDEQPSDEIPPLDTDPGQTEDPGDSPGPDDAPPDTAAPQAEPPSGGAADIPAEPGE